MARSTTDRRIRTGLKAAAAAAIALVGLNLTRLTPHDAASAPAAAPAPVAPPAARAPLPPAAKPALTKAAMADPTVIKRVLKIDGPFRHGDYVWDDANVPAGPVIITVDLAAQTLSVFRGGYEIGAAVILYGADNMPTPLGDFTITQKDKDHVSNLYDAPMPYMLRLTNDGISIHGTKSIRPDEATHGCVGVPVPFAAKLFAQVKLGDHVIVTRGKMLNPKGALPAA